MRVHAIAVLSVFLCAAAATTALADVPPAPENVRKTRIDAEHYLLTWQDTGGNEDGFEILRRSVFTTNFESRGTVGADVTEFLDDVPAGEVFVYRVVAFNEDGDSDLSNECYVNRYPPPAPSNINVRLIALYVVRISWADRSGGERGFEIQRAAEGGAFKTIAKVPSNAEVYDDDTLRPANTYTYRVRALGRPAICWNHSKFTVERTVTTKGGVKIVEVELRGRGKGTVTSSPAGISCGPKDDHCAAEFPSSTHVILTAKPNSTSRFAGWVDYPRCEGTKTPCDVWTNEDHVVGAVFKLRP